MIGKFTRWRPSSALQSWLNIRNYICSYAYVFSLTIWPREEGAQFVVAPVNNLLELLAAAVVAHHLQVHQGSLVPVQKLPWNDIEEPITPDICLPGVLKSCLAAGDHVELVPHRLQRPVHSHRHRQTVLSGVGLEMIQRKLGKLSRNSLQNRLYVKLILSPSTFNFLS